MLGLIGLTLLTSRKVGIVPVLKPNTSCYQSHIRALEEAQTEQMRKIMHLNERRYESENRTEYIEYMWSSLTDLELLWWDVSVSTSGPPQFPSVP